VVFNFLALVVYLGIAYVPFSFCIGLMWFAGAFIFRKTKGQAWKIAMKRSAKEATITTIVILMGLFFLGMAAFLVEV